MPPRDDELPEGTDQIINGAMETGAGAGASTGSGSGGFGGVGAGGTTPGGSADFASGGSGSGFIGAGGGDDTGGFAGGTTAGSGGTGFSGSDLGSSGGGYGGSSGGGSFGSSSGTGVSGGATDQLKSGVQGLKSQATDKVRAYAVDGKEKATTALDDLSQVVNEAAQSIDDRLGAQYGDYARRAATAVSGFADTVRGKDVDELFDDARDIVRKSPGVAIGAAAVIGFSLIRLLKAGMPDTERKDVSFQADPALSGPDSGGSSSMGVGGTTSQAPYVAPNTISGV